MSTIVLDIDNHQIWSDGQVTGSDDVIVQDDFCKIHPMFKNVIACTGSATFHNVLKEYIVDQSKPFPKLEDHQHGSLFWFNYDNQTYKILWTTGGPNGYLKVTNGKHCIGSGENFARSALMLGCSAKEAVLHAMKFDPYTGGKLFGYDLRLKEFIDVP